MKAIAMVAVLTIMSICPVWAQQTQMEDGRPKITVNGEAVVNVKPDKIVVTLGIETWDAEIMYAKQKNNDILKKAVAAIKESGIPEKEIQTDHLSIEPRYKSDHRQEDFMGYFVRNTFVVTLAETDKVEELVTKVLQAGVNYIHGVDFQTTEFNKYREQARELALKEAKEKAEKMAGVLGQSVGAPIQINENQGRSAWWYYPGWSGWGYGTSQGILQNAIHNVEGRFGEVSDANAPGRISIRASVSVTFELKK